MIKDTLQLRANIFVTVRQFFADRDVLEVDTPTLTKTAVSDPHLHSLQTQWTCDGQRQTAYLITSPEYYMKRLLAQGSGSIFQISKAFRDDELGRHHQPEFWLLEWYRVDWDYRQLMMEVDALLQYLLNTPQADQISYRQLFWDYLQIDPHRATVNELQKMSEQQSIHLSEQAINMGKDALLMLLLTHCIEPQLGQDKPIFIYDYPASQAALAKIRTDSPPVAERFEVYYHGIELANGFDELTDAKEQAERFSSDNQQRQQLGLPTIIPDEQFLAALDQGLPDCAGVALGLGRLILLAARADHLAQVVPFAW